MFHIFWVIWLSVPLWGVKPQVDIDGVNLNEEVEVELENQQREGIIN